MSLHPSLAYGQAMSERAARAVMNGGRAASPRVAAIVASARPAQGETRSIVRSILYSTDPLLPAGMTRRRHRGAEPWLDGCVCDCHGNGDTTGASCDVDSCQDVLITA